MPLDVLAVHRINPRDLVHGRWANLDTGDADARRLLGGEITDTTLRASLFRSGRQADIVGTTQGVLVLVTQRFRETLTSLGMTGWATLRVELDAGLPADLRLLVVTGRAGPIDSSKHNPLPGLPALGEFLDPRDWDESDVFLADGLSEVLIAPDRVGALRRARLRNLGIEPAALEPWPAR